ncbi:MAG: DUF2934 domain-containing protein [Nitrospira sp.]|nr:DUF2934 domain-containing protein [Nitrospira sp.]MCP9461957.1 DUF2934 domain-containing protein [Nitrospira sp.]MCP9473641.1 DUF2934 domain-containing protein [Nitrospira sp.]
MRAKTKKTGPSKGRSSAAVAAAVSNKPIELPDGMWERIAKKAYELWEQRGRQDGNDLRDWFDAEAIVMEEIHEARE